MAILINNALTISKLKARFLEPYTSETINRFFFTQGLIGIHYGFDIMPDPGTGPLAVKLEHDTARGRSLAVIPSYAQRLGFAFDEDTEQILDLAAYVGQRVYIFLYVEYVTTGSPTEVRLRVADAAELGQPWTLSALLLGSVRVPSAGALTIGQIDKGSAVYAGLLSGGSRRWQPMTTNPEFNKGLAGLELGNADVFPTNFVRFTTISGHPQLEIGDTSGIRGAQGPHGVALTVPDVKAGDLVLVRLAASAASIANGSTLNIAITPFGYNQVLLSANAAMDVYGILYTVPSDAAVLGISLMAVLPNVNSTARFLVDRFEVFKLRTDVGLSGDHASPDYLAARVLCFGSSGDPSYSSLLHLGSQNHPTFRLPTTGNNTTQTKPVALTEDGYTTPSLKLQSDDGPSLLRGALQGTRAYGVVSALFPQAVIDGADFTVMLPNIVQLSSGILNASPLPTEAQPYGSSYDDVIFGPIDSSYNVGLGVNVPTTGAPVLIMWDGDQPDIESRLIAIEASALASYPNATPLAWVTYDTGTSQIVDLIDLRDKLTNVQGKLAMIVGEDTNPKARMSLKAALQLVGIFSGATLQGRAVASFEIVVSGRHTIDSTLVLHSGVTIRGQTRGTAGGQQAARLLLASGVTTMFSTGNASISDVTIKDLILAAEDAGCTAIKVEDTQSITRLSLQSCRFLDPISPWKHVVETGASAAHVNGLHVERCEIIHSSATDDSVGILLRDQSLAGLDNTIVDTIFTLASPSVQVGEHIRIANSSTGTTHLSRCRGDLIQGDDAADTVAGGRYGIDVAGNVLIESCFLSCSVRCRPGITTARTYRISNTTIVRSGAAGGGNVLRTYGLRLDKSGAGSATTVAQLSNVRVLTTGLTSFAAPAFVTAIGLQGGGTGRVILQASNVEIRLVQGVAGQPVYGIWDGINDGLSQMLLDNVSIQGNNPASGTLSNGVTLSALARLSVLKGLRVEDIDDNRAVRFEAGAQNNVLGFMTVKQATAGAGYTEDVPAANTIDTGSIVVVT
jgi:hypothetical protein